MRHVRPAARWEGVPPAPEGIAERLAAALRPDGARPGQAAVPIAICRLLAARGVHDVETAKRFLRPALEQVESPEQLADLPRAADRLVAAIQRGEPILVHGDYDVDGICSTTLMTRALRALGGQAIPFIPDRLKDGYDLGAAGVAAARAAGAKVVLTCDCGTTAVAPARDLLASGIDLIVTDHHLPGAELPVTFALVNPRRADCPSLDKDLAAVGVAYKLALAVTRRLGGDEGVVHEMLDLVALATVADVAPLRGENRVFVRLGLKRMQETRNLGLRALIRAARLDAKPLTAGRIGFTLAPRLNALGRLRQALRGVELLMAETESAANARNFGSSNIASQTRTADATEAFDHALFALIFELYLQLLDSLAVHAHVSDVAFLFEDASDAFLHLGMRQLDGRQQRTVCIANAGQHV